MKARTRSLYTEAKYRLLYVGSDLELVAALRKALPMPEYRLVACPDRTSAILFLKSRIPYHLLLIDLEWRDTDGLKLARMARSLRHRKKLPNVLVSATELTKRMAALARRSGVIECTTKTKDMGEVVEVVTRLIRDKPSQR